LYATVYPNKIFDYMAAGKPVILAIDGVVRQVVEEARAGVFVPPGNAATLANAIREMAGQPLEAREMVRRGRRFVEEHFDRAVLAEKLVAVLEKV
jgi:glycosyltransferase involved in cell wall biosynthesis